VVVLDAAREQAAATTLAGLADGPAPVIPLAACGSGHRVLRDEGGEAMTGASLRLTAVLAFTAGDKQPQEVETKWYETLRRPERPRTDDAGRFSLPTLVAGLRYRLYVTAGRGQRLAHEFTVTP